MGLTNEEILKIKEDFKKEYDFSRSEYLLGVGPRQIGTASAVVAAGSSPMSLKEGESLEDRCLLVTLSRTVPTEVKLPNIYKSARVFYEFEEEIRAGSGEKSEF